MTSTEQAMIACREAFEREIDDMAQRIVASIGPAPHAHAGGILLLCATRIIGHLAGHLDNVRADQGQDMHGPEASMHEAYSLVNIGRPHSN